MDRLRHYRLETGHHLNIFVAAGICIADGSLSAMCRALHAAASALAEDGCANFIDELAGLPPGSTLSRSAISSACFDEAGVEDLCDAYLANLHRLKLGIENSFDPVQIADLLLDHLLDDEPLQGAATLYAHNWKVIRRYKLNGWHILVPLIIAFDLGLPEMNSLHKLKRFLDRISSGSSSNSAEHLLEQSGLSDFRDGRRLLKCLIDNRWDVAFNAGSSSEVCATRAAALCLELLARFGRDHQWFRLSGVTMASDEVPSIEFDHANTANFLAHHCVEVAGRRGCEQMLVKALLRRREPERLKQGLSACLYDTLTALLVERQQVVSVEHVRQHCCLQTLNINPYAILPGRILVYAPSPRFLDPSAVTFVLKEWVQDSVHRKGRIAPDRVLTPLLPIRWHFNEADLISMIRSCSSFELFGVAFWSEMRRRLMATVPAQARNWAIYHLDRQSLQVLRKSGLYRVDDMILDEASWGDLTHTSRAHVVVASTIANAHDVSVHERDAAIARLRDGHLHLPLAKLTQ